MLSESLDSKIHLENKFHHKMSLNFCHVILPREIHVKFFGVKISEKPPKKGFLLNEGKNSLVPWWPLWPLVNNHLQMTSDTHHL